MNFETMGCEMTYPILRRTALVHHKTSRYRLHALYHGRRKSNG